MKPAFERMNMHTDLKKFSIEVNPVPGHMVYTDPMRPFGGICRAWNIRLVERSTGQLLVSCGFSGSEEEAFANAPALLQEQLRNLRKLAAAAIGELDTYIRATGGTAVPPSNMADQLAVIMNSVYVESGMLNDADREAECIVDNYGLGVLVEALKIVIAENSKERFKECALHMLSVVAGGDPVALEVAELCRESTDTAVQERLIGLAEDYDYDQVAVLLNTMPITEAWVSNFRNKVLAQLLAEKETSNGRKHDEI